MEGNKTSDVHIML